jgi:FkbM family methyltransferase
MDTLTGHLDDNDVLRLAADLSWVRPLGPYPGWHFDADWDNPALAFRLRREVWCHFRRRPAVPVVVPWHDGLHFRLQLSNDLSKQLFVGGCYEPNEFALLAEVLTPGMTFLDAGANEGLYTLFAARCVGGAGAVWAFEPSSREFTRLRHNVQMNRLGNVRLFPLALGKENVKFALQVAEDEHSGQSTLGAFAWDTERAGVEQVPVRRLDDLARAERLRRVDVIKMDVEGAELAALEGAEGVLTKHRPVLLLEVNEQALRHQGASGAALAQFLRGHDYALFAFDQASGRPVPSGPDQFSDNVVAAPRGGPVARRLGAGTG